MTTKHTKATLSCTHNTAGFILIASGFLYLLIGCSALYEWSGKTKPESQHQTAQDQAALSKAIADAGETLATKLKEGQSLAAAGTAAASVFAWKLATILAASTGTILTGLLAKWLTTEKKITKAIITGVEKAEDQTLKNTIKEQALTLGIESALHTRVKQLT